MSNVTNRTKAVMTLKKVKCAIPCEKSLQIWLISLCWALSLHVDKPLKSDAWPVRCKINKLVTFRAAGHHQQYEILTQMLILLPFNSRFPGESGSASSSLGPHSPPVLEKTAGDWWNAGGGEFTG